MSVNAGSAEADDESVDLYGDGPPTKEFMKEEVIRADLPSHLKALFEAKTRAQCTDAVAAIQKACQFDPDCLTSRIFLKAANNLLQLRLALLDGRGEDAKVHWSKVKEICSNDRDSLEHIEQLLPMSIGRLQAQINSLVNAGIRNVLSAETADEDDMKVD